MAVRHVKTDKLSRRRTRKKKGKNWESKNYTVMPHYDFWVSKRNARRFFPFKDWEGYTFQRLLLKIICIKYTMFPELSVKGKILFAKIFSICLTPSREKRK